MGYHNLSDLIKVTELSERAGDVWLWNKPGIILRWAQSAPESSLWSQATFPSCCSEGWQEAAEQLCKDTQSTQDPAASPEAQPCPGTHCTESGLFTWALHCFLVLPQLTTTIFQKAGKEPIQKTMGCFIQTMIFISADLRVFMYRYQLYTVRYHRHLLTCPLKIHFLIFRTDLGSGFRKCNKIKPLPLQTRC